MCHTTAIISDCVTKLQLSHATPHATPHATHTPPTRTAPTRHPHARHPLHLLQVARKRAQQEMSDRGKHFRRGQLAGATQRWGAQGKVSQKWVGRYFSGTAAVLTLPLTPTPTPYHNPNQARAAALRHKT